jgi:putative transposase
MARQHTIGRTILRRVRLILYAEQGYSSYRISQLIKMDANWVGIWRKRWEEKSKSLAAYEQGNFGDQVSNFDLMKIITTILSDQPRPGVKPRIGMEQREQIIALACENPEDYGIPVSHWTGKLLAQVAIKLGLVDHISPRHVSRILKKNTATA